jgi:hypothetical protein
LTVGYQYRPPRPLERGSDGRFRGGIRVNVEAAPRLPAWPLGRIFDYQLPVDLFWKSCVGGEAFAARVVRFQSTREPAQPMVQIWEDGGAQAWQLRFIAAPHGGGQTLVVCPDCSKAVRHLYPLQVLQDGVFLCPWRCRLCAGLRYRSEGSWRPSNRAWGPYPRPWTYGDPVATPVEAPAEVTR